MEPRLEELAWTVFDTELGCCALVWSAQGIRGSQLPEADGDALRERLLQRFPGAGAAAPPSWVARAMAGVQALLAGRSLDLMLDVPLDETGLPPFRRRVHALTRQIPVGQTRSYGELARQLGQPGASRSVGMAQGQNPFAPIVPCHRVLGTDGALTGFSAAGGVALKRRLLLIEARACGQLGGDQQPLF